MTSDDWLCGACAFRNIGTLRACDMCDAPKPDHRPRPPLGPVDYTGMYQNFLGMMFMQPGAVGMGLPLVPSLPMLDGLPGMSVRRAGSYFGPHWDAQVTARSTAAAEALVEPLGLLPQNTEHPSYPPGVPLRFGFSTTYPQVAQAMGGPAGFL